MRDAIVIDQLELAARLGVPAAERAQPQRLQLTLRLEPTRDFRALEDRLEQTIDYAAVCHFVQTVSAGFSGQLLETLADEITRRTLAEFPLAAVTVELRKFILPETNFVAVQLCRTAADTIRHAPAHAVAIEKIE